MNRRTSPEPCLCPLCKGHNTWQPPEMIVEEVCPICDGEGVIWQELDEYTPDDYLEDFYEDEVD